MGGSYDSYGTKIYVTSSQFMKAIVESVEGVKKTSSLEKKNVIGTLLSLVVMFMAVTIASSSFSVLLKPLCQSIEPFDPVGSIRFVQQAGPGEGRSPLPEHHRGYAAVPRAGTPLSFRAQRFEFVAALEIKGTRNHDFLHRYELSTIVFNVL